MNNNIFFFICQFLKFLEEFLDISISISNELFTCFLPTSLTA